MFSFTIITALVASLVAAAPASTVTHSGYEIQKRQDAAGNGTVIMCTEANWKGECIALSVSLVYDSCTTLPAPFFNNITSFEPVYGTVCWLQMTSDCSDGCRSPSGCNEIVEFPGYADLTTYGSWATTQQVGSITCEASTNVPS